MPTTTKGSTKSTTTKGSTKSTATKGSTKSTTKATTKRTGGRASGTTRSGPRSAMTKTTGEFELTGWDEETYEQLDGGGKLTRATVTQRFHGDLDGDGSVQWLMAYADDGTARFVGLQRVTGSLGGRTGGCVLEVEGGFDGKVASGTWTVVPGSGTDGLRGLEGHGGFEAPMGPKATWTLEYRLP